MLRIETIAGKIPFIPTKQHIGDCGWDVYSLEHKILQPGETYKFMLGFKILGERGKYYRTEDRSSMALKGLKVIGPVIDNGYRGEVSIILHNMLNIGEFEIKKGDKIAQILVELVEDDNVLETNGELQTITLTDRNTSGYGSTGK